MDDLHESTSTAESVAFPCTHAQIPPETVYELRSQIGLSTASTDAVVAALQTYAPSPEMLPVCTLLILEKFEDAVRIARSVLEQHFSAEFLVGLQSSPYFLQRLAVPALLSGARIATPLKHEFLLAALKDSVSAVVVAAVDAIAEEGARVLREPPGTDAHGRPLLPLFGPAEIHDLIAELSKSDHTAVRVAAAGLLPLLAPGDPLLAVLAQSPAWRVRLRVAQLLPRLAPSDRATLASALRHDAVDEVRVRLAAGTDTLDALYFFDDPCEHVRAAYLARVLDKLSDEALFKRLMTDESWEVKKHLLDLRGEWVLRVTVPFIKSSAESDNWRIKYDILALIHGKLAEEAVVRPLCQFILECLSDRVCEVREKAAAVLVDTIWRYEWCAEFEAEIRAAIASPNYLHRISAMRPALAFERRTGVVVTAAVADDPVKNVRESYQEAAAEMMER